MKLKTLREVSEQFEALDLGLSRTIIAGKSYEKNHDLLGSLNFAFENNWNISDNDVIISNTNLTINTPFLSSTLSGEDRSVHHDFINHETSSLMYLSGSSDTIVYNFENTYDETGVYGGYYSVYDDTIGGYNKIYFYEDVSQRFIPLGVENGKASYFDNVTGNKFIVADESNLVFARLLDENEGVEYFDEISGGYLFYNYGFSYIDEEGNTNWASNGLSTTGRKHNATYVDSDPNDPYSGGEIQYFDEFTGEYVSIGTHELGQSRFDMISAGVYVDRQTGNTFFIENEQDYTHLLFYTQTGQELDTSVTDYEIYKREYEDVYWDELASGYSNVIRLEADILYTGYDTLRAQILASEQQEEERLAALDAAYERREFARIVKDFRLKTKTYEEQWNEYYAKRMSGEIAPETPFKYKNDVEQLFPDQYARMEMMAAEDQYLNGLERKINELDTTLSSQLINYINDVADALRQQWGIDWYKSLTIEIKELFESTLLPIISITITSKNPNAPK